MHRRTNITATTSAALASVMAGRASAAGKTIVVGGKDFTEQLIMAEMTAQLLRANGFSVDTRDRDGKRRSCARPW